MTDSPVVLGLDFGGTKIAVAVCDLAGVRLGATTIESLGSAGAEATMARGLDVAKELLRSFAEDRPLAAVGAATFGIPFDDRVELAPTISGWDSLEFGARVRAAFPGVPVRLATDVKAAAQAELRWGALAGCRYGLYVNLGTGLACAIVAEGGVITGAHLAAGEIGYNLRSADDVGVVFAERTILESVVSGRALADRTSARLGRAVTAAEVFELAAHDRAAHDLLAQFNRELAMHVVNLAIAVDPERVAVGGGMVRSWPMLGPVLQHALEVAVPFPPQLVTAAFPFDAPLIGALALGVEAAAVGIGEEALT